MKRQIISLAITFTVLTLGATSLLADGPQQRTIFIRDGKVISDGRVLELDGELLGGKRAYLGVSLIDITDDLRAYYGADKDAGVLVGGIEAGGPAEKAGVRVGDIIVGVDGKDVESSTDLRRTLRNKKDGETVRIDVLRGKSRQTIVATVAEKELPTMLRGNLEDLTRGIGQTFNSPEWRARVERLQNCDELQAKLKELESRMKDLEKKLQR